MPQPSQPSSSHKFCLPNAVTSSLQDTFLMLPWVLNWPSANPESPLELSCLPAVNIFLSVWPAEPTCLLMSHQPTTPVSISFPPSPATPLHDPRARRTSHGPQPGLRDILPKLPPASHLLCLRLHRSKSPPQNTSSTGFQPRQLWGTIQTVSPFCLSQQNICLWVFTGQR